MHDKKTPSQSGGLSLDDIYYVLFRRKWLVIGFSAAGLIAALLVRAIMPAPYQSEAKLFIRYVMDSKSLNPMGGDSKVVQSLTDQGDAIINGELEILKSLDLANEVAKEIGPQRILGQGAGTNEQRAGLAIRNGLQVDPPQRGSVIKLAFKHSDQFLVQDVLNKVIDVYFKKHVEIHGAVGIFEEVLTRETDQLRSRLKGTEDALRKAKVSAGVISVEDTRKGYTEQISKIRQELFNAEAELVERNAAVQELNKRFPAKTNAPASTEGSSVPPEQLSEYNTLCSRLDGLRKREQELLTQFTPENALVKEVRQQIIETEKSKQKAEEENPKLATFNVVVPKTGEHPPVDLFTETVQITALGAKIEVLSKQLDKIRNEATTMDETERVISELQRTKELEDSRYRYYSESLERARVNDALSSGKVSNISKIQEPSPPFKDAEKLHKLLLTILLGGIAAGIGLAFVVELYLDRSVRRPAEIEARLNLPLFVSMPDTKRNGYARAHKKRRNKPLPVVKTEEANSPGPGNGSPSTTNGTGEVAPWDVKHPLRPFYEGLRDRLVTYFEVRNLTHKPKLVAVAGCAKGAGVTSTAAGLAACLSEAGDGNVLLVDMNLAHGAAHHFYKGELACGLDEVLENGKRDDALVQDNLYVVSEGSNSDKLPRIMPKRFTSLVPKLKASDYDYIIFDMPPISQISITPRLASFMDIVLLVVESEKTDRDLVKRAAALLAESKANVGVVLNRTRSHVPRKLLQEF
jgi:uncharacterized protein involved in exopolysaccharide biosynthesis/Mrp family chromosome partitioning ATPase